MQEGVAGAGGAPAQPPLLQAGECLHWTGCHVGQGPKLRSGALAVRREEQAPGGQPRRLVLLLRPAAFHIDLPALP